MEEIFKLACQLTMENVEYEIIIGENCIYIETKYESKTEC